MGRVVALRGPAWGGCLVHVITDPEQVRDKQLACLLLDFATSGVGVSVAMGEATVVLVLEKAYLDLRSGLQPQVTRVQLLAAVFERLVRTGSGNSSPGNQDPTLADTGE